MLWKIQYLAIKIVDTFQQVMPILLKPISILSLQILAIRSLNTDAIALNTDTFDTDTFDTNTYTSSKKDTNTFDTFTYIFGIDFDTGQILPIQVSVRYYLNVWLIVTYQYMLFWWTTLRIQAWKRERCVAGGERVTVSSFSIVLAFSTALHTWNMIQLSQVKLLPWSLQQP